MNSNWETGHLFLSSDALVGLLGACCSIAFLWRCHLTNANKEITIHLPHARTLCSDYSRVFGGESLWEALQLDLSYITNNNVQNLHVLSYQNIDYCWWHAQKQRTFNIICANFYDGLALVKDKQKPMELCMQD